MYEPPTFESEDADQPSELIQAQRRAFERTMRLGDRRDVYRTAFYAALSGSAFQLEEGRLADFGPDALRENAQIVAEMAVGALCVPPDGPPVRPPDPQE